jgi:hypothetical protein
MAIPADADCLALGKDGAQVFRALARPCLANVLNILAGSATDRAGIRLVGMPDLARYLAPTGPIGSLASRLLSQEGKAVRAILFDKNERANWSLAWHQDRTICVQDRREVPGFGPWSIKAGLHHVAPPFDLLARMVTLRIHLDDVPATNAPLAIAIGSHRRGRVPVAQVKHVVAQCQILRCLALAGDVWAYSTPILHASEAADTPVRRRVLQVDFSADSLPDGLQWLGI